MLGTKDAWGYIYLCDYSQGGRLKTAFSGLRRTLQVFSMITTFQVLTIHSGLGSHRVNT